MGTRTRNPTTALDHVLTKVLDAEIFKTAFLEAGTLTTNDFMTLTEHDFAINIVGLNLMQQKRCRSIQEWFLAQGNDDVNQWFLLTPELLDNWRMQRVRETAKANQPEPAKMDQLQRSVTLDTSHYHELKEAKFWMKWNREFRTTVRYHGM